MPRNAPVTVVETPEFISASSRLMTVDERELLIDYLASNPLAGDVMIGTGGVRKLRWALAGRGKRGGARVIYFYHNPGMPLFALTAYAKNQQADIGTDDRKEFKKLTAALVSIFVRKAP